MRQLRVPSPLEKTVTTIKSFKGVDLTNAPTNVADGRSPEAPNMIRDTPGKVRKRMGYYLDKEYTDVIYGVHHLKNIRFIHAGNKLYQDEAVLYSDMNTARSKSWALGDRLYILDGKTYLVLGKFGADDTYSVKPVSEIATVPTTFISRKPNGEGIRFQEINFLQPKFINEFLADGETKVYQLSLDELNSVDKVEIMNADGDWEEKKVTTDYTVDLKLGTVTFNTVPAKSPVSGRDNVRITASKTIEGYADTINHCTISIVYGVQGATDRLFVGGNPEYPNRDWFSGLKSVSPKSSEDDETTKTESLEDFTFFGDLSYSTIGLDTNEIIGYSLVGNYLAAHKSDGADGRNVIMRYGEYVTQNNIERASFRIVSTIQGAGAIGKYNFAYLNESLFATKLGIYAITAQDITGEKFTQERSYYIRGALENENLENSYAIAWKDFYVLATDKRIYLLDSLQKVYEKNNPYSSYQYECYYWEIPNISVLFTEDETLCFGTNDGRIMKFYTDKSSQTSYNDNGEPIKARWDTNAMDGELFYKKKNFKYLSASIAPAIATGFEAWAQVKGLWTRLYDSGAKARYFDFRYIDFSKINFSSDTTPRTLGHKIRLKRVDKVRFSFRNEELNEPFGLYAIGTEFTESGNYKS